MAHSFAIPADADGLYCAGCNERFRHAAGVCPRCGADLSQTPDPVLAETLLLKDASDDFRGSDPADSAADGGDDESDQLVGRCLHIYECHSLLGRGGMGRVYLARHLDLHRPCALKILSPRAAARDVDYVQRFQLEGRAAAALVHPNVVTIHAIGQCDSLHYLEMEFVAGPSLAQLVRDEGRLTPIRATALATRVAEGLAAAHRQNIVHRDLKPDNVLLTHQGIPKIADFGLAKRIVSGTDHSRHLAGTPNFMAPELFDGCPATPASDVYALGATYFLLLTGRFPYVAGSLSRLMQAVRYDPLPSVRSEFPDIPLEMAECLNLLMAKCPDARPRSAIGAAQLLAAVWGQVRDIESLLIEALHDHPGVTWTRTGSRYRLNVQLAEGRRQTVLVEPSEHAAAERLLVISSLCCPAQPEYFEQALRLNGEMAHGSLAIRELDGRPMFCVVNSYPRSTVDPEEVRRSVLEIAIRADAVEKLLTGADDH
ncbi:MAG TPA: serine/threonine-protein kinase [Planctomycetaceae bacterium]|nr:serine/threonine-protein kinase [Planctomycetaceae bacterium]